MVRVLAGVGDRDEVVDEAGSHALGRQTAGG